MERLAIPLARLAQRVEADGPEELTFDRERYGDARKNAVQTESSPDLSGWGSRRGPRSDIIRPARMVSRNQGIDASPSSGAGAGGKPVRTQPNRSVSRPSGWTLKKLQRSRSSPSPITRSASRIASFTRSAGQVDELDRQVVDEPFERDLLLDQQAVRQFDLLPRGNVHDRGEYEEPVLVLNRVQRNFDGKLSAVATASDQSAYGARRIGSPKWTWIRRRLTRAPGTSPRAGASRRGDQ